MTGTSPDNPVLAVLTAVILTAGVLFSLGGMAGYLAAAVLAVSGLGAIAVAMARRERRIRARLADPRTRPHPTSGATRAGATSSTTSSMTSSMTRSEVA